MQRVLQSSAAVLTATFLNADEVATDPTPATATVTVARADGTVLVASQAATRTGPGVFTYTLTTTQTALLDVLNATWTSSLGTIRTVTEIVGAFLFTVTEARTALGDPAYSASKIIEARTYAETELESALGYALVPRYSYARLTGSSGALRTRPYTRSVRSATVNGTALSASDLAGIDFDSSGYLYDYSWAGDPGHVLIGYEHGLDTPPSGAKRAALALALDYLGTDTSGIDPRAESIVTVDGTIRLRSGAGQFAALGVNEWIAANRVPAIA